MLWASAVGEGRVSNPGPDRHSPGLAPFYGPWLAPKAGLDRPSLGWGQFYGLYVRHGRHARANIVPYFRRAQHCWHGLCRLHHACVYPDLPMPICLRHRLRLWVGDALYGADRGGDCHGRRIHRRLDRALCAAEGATADDLSPYLRLSRALAWALVEGLSQYYGLRLIIMRS